MLNCRTGRWYFYKNFFTIAIQTTSTRISKACLQSKITAKYTNTVIYLRIISKSEIWLIVKKAVLFWAILRLWICTSFCTTEYILTMSFLLRSDKDQFHDVLDHQLVIWKVKLLMNKRHRNCSLVVKNLFFDQIRSILLFHWREITSEQCCYIKKKTKALWKSNTVTFLYNP